MNSSEFFDYTLVAAAILAAIHFFGPHLRQRMRGRHQIAASYGGGLAIAYVFLQLFPEIEAGHEWLGDAIHFITLGSFLTFFALEVWLHRHHLGGVDSGSEAAKARSYWFHVGLTWVYTWLVVYAMPGEVIEELSFVIAGTLAIGLHMIYKSYTLHSHHSSALEESGRWVLATAPFAGWITRSFLEPSETIFDIFIAILSGFLMQSVFLEELPSRDVTRIGWVVGGTMTLMVLVVVVP